MHALPTLAEIPAASDSRDTEQLLRLSLIPADDGVLRAAAVALFNADEDGCNKPAADYETFKNMLLDLSARRALTPGGLAWKLETVLHFFSTEEHWDWWRYLLQSAVSDAIELERVRALAVSDGADLVEALGQRWQASRARFEATPETPATVALRDRLTDEWATIEWMMVETPATSLAGVVAKARTVRENTMAGSTPDGRNLALTDSIIADLERMQPAPAIAHAIAAE